MAQSIKDIRKKITELSRVADRSDENTAESINYEIYDLIQEIKALEAK